MCSKSVMPNLGSFEALTVIRRFPEMPFSTKQLFQFHALGSDNQVNFKHSTLYMGKPTDATQSPTSSADIDFGKLMFIHYIEKYK